ncbi:11638_t:CDS:2, partial [Scutellospora calospora]
MDISEQTLKEVFLGQDVAEILSRRKLHIQGLTSNQLTTSVKEILGSASKTNKAIKNTENKENQNLIRNNYEESSKDKEERIQNQAEA